MIPTVEVLQSGRLLIEKVAPFALSLYVAETYFRFGSFTRECLAFLALWYALDWVYEKVKDIKTS